MWYFGHNIEISIKENGLLEFDDGRTEIRVGLIREQKNTRIALQNEQIIDNSRTLYNDSVHVIKISKIREGRRTCWIKNWTKIISFIWTENTIFYVYYTIWIVSTFTAYRFGLLDGAIRSLVGTLCVAAIVYYCGWCCGGWFGWNSRRRKSRRSHSSWTNLIFKIKQVNKIKNKNKNKNK